MCIRDSQRWSLYNRILEIKDEFLPGWRQLRAADAELKGQYLSRAIRRLEQGLKADKPTAFEDLDYEHILKLIDSLFQAIDTFDPTFYFVGIDKNRLTVGPTEASAPISIAYVLLLAHAGRYAQAEFGIEEGGLFIADEQNQHERIFRNGEVRRLLEEVIDDKSRMPSNRGILDKPLWVNSGQLQLDGEILQLVDLAVYIVGRAVTEGDITDEWFQRLLPHIDRRLPRDSSWNQVVDIFPLP